MRLTETWLAARRESSEGRICRIIEVLAEDRTPRLTATAFPWRPGIEVEDVRGRRAFAIVRRRWFAVSGASDVTDGGGSAIGIVHRSGKALDAHRRLVGRFQDERRLTGSIRTGAIEALANAVAGLEGTTAGSGPTGYAWIVDGRIAGWLRRLALPPLEREREAAVSRRTTPDGWLRKMVATIRRPEPPATWCFQHAPLPGVDPALLDAAAITAIEQSYW